MYPACTLHFQVQEKTSESLPQSLVNWKDELVIQIERLTLRHTQTHWLRNEWMDGSVHWPASLLRKAHRKVEAWRRNACITAFYHLALASTIALTRMHTLLRNYYYICTILLLCCAYNSSQSPLPQQQCPVTPKHIPWIYHICRKEHLSSFPSLLLLTTISDYMVNYFE